MKYNLLQNTHDFYTELFIKGSISYYDFELLETKFLQQSELFTINLN